MFVSDCKVPPQFFFPAQDVRLHGSQWATQNLRGFLVRQTVLTTENHGCALGWMKPSQRFSQVQSQRGVRRSGGFFLFQFRGVDVLQREFFSLTTRRAEFVESNAQQPSGKTRGAAKRSQLLPRFQKRFLREIIRAMRIASRHANEETAHERLMTPHQFAESIPVFVRKNAGNQLCV
jgi:hypothetical protein